MLDWIQGNPSLLRYFEPRRGHAEVYSEGGVIWGVHDLRVQVMHGRSGQRSFASRHRLDRRSEAGLGNVHTYVDFRGAGIRYVYESSFNFDT